MKTLIQIALALLIALQLIQQLPLKSLARTFPDVNPEDGGLPPDVTVNNKTSTKKPSPTKPKPADKNPPKTPTTPTKPSVPTNSTSSGRDKPQDIDPNSSTAASTASKS